MITASRDSSPSLALVYKLLRSSAFGSSPHALGMDNLCSGKKMIFFFLKEILGKNKTKNKTGTFSLGYYVS